MFGQFGIWLVFWDGSLCLRPPRLIAIPWCFATLLPNNCPFVDKWIQSCDEGPGTKTYWFLEISRIVSTR